MVSKKGGKKAIAYLHQEIDSLLQKYASKEGNTNLIKAPFPLLKKKFVKRASRAMQTLIEEGLIREENFNRKLFNSLLKRHTFAEVKLQKTPQDELEISNQNILNIYQWASSLFQDGNYETASNIFLLLTFLNPKIASFWVGMGMSEEMNSNFEIAVMAYLFAIDSNDEDLQPAIYCAECLIKLNEPGKARKFLDLALQEVGNLPAHLDFKRQALQLRSSL